MPRPDPTIAASDETAFENVETILVELHGKRASSLTAFATPDFDRAMWMAHELFRLVRRHRLNRRIRS